MSLLEDRAIGVLNYRAIFPPLSGSILIKTGNQMAGNGVELVGSGDWAPGTNVCEAMEHPLDPEKESGNACPTLREH